VVCGRERLGVVGKGREASAGRQGEREP